MPKIDDLPENVSDAGLDFNYAVWTAGTVLTLANVRWNADYRDIVKFETQSALNTYISENAGPVHVMSGVTYAAANRPIRIDMPFNPAFRYNYIRVSNPTQPINGDDFGRTFYYFITAIRYIAPNVTELEIQLDVWQTFAYQITFGNCYIERGHFGIANEFARADQGRGYLTVPEGLDIGSEYQIAKTYVHTIGGTEHLTPTNTFDIIVLTTVTLTMDPGDINDPNLTTAKGSNFQGLPNGGELYWFPDMDNFSDFVDVVAATPWISQGIIGIYAVPNLLDWALTFVEHDFEGVTVRRLIGEGYPARPITFSASAENPGDWKQDILDLLPEKYRHLRKFMTWPYSTVEVTTYSGTPLTLKPESMDDLHISFEMMLHLAPPSPRVAFYPVNINRLEGDTTTTHPTDPGGDNAEFLDLVTGIMNLPTFSLVNNSYIMSVASQANSLPYQRASADWSQQKALTGAQTAYEQSGGAIGAQNAQTGLQNQTMRAQTDLANTVAGQRAIVGGINSVIGGIGGGAAGVAGAAVGIANQAADYAITTNQNNQSTALSQNQNTRSTQISTGQAEMVRDTNRDYAQFASRGDYANAIAGINAKVQDAQLLQPGTVGQMGGDAFNLAMYRWALHAKVKIVNSGAVRQIGDFWLRYGYAVNRFGKMPTDLKCMTKFTYWKLRETYITSSTCPEMFRQTIRGIFEKGVTVWSNPSDIGTIDIGDNDPLEGIHL